MSGDLDEKLDRLPDRPGVYLYKDAKAQVIYVGKAASLRSRVRSYFQESRPHDPKTDALVRAIRDLDYLVTDNELEALMLEATLVRKHRPRYNIILRDDKHYPFLRLTTNEPFPRLVVARRVASDGATYYGPFYPATAMRETLRLTRQLFPLRTCSIEIDGRLERPCIQYHIGRCRAPCTGWETREGYARTVAQVAHFLEGKDDALAGELTREMEAAAADLNFERAAMLRDRIQALHRVRERQKMISTVEVDQDVIGLVRQGGDACVELFFVRRGRLVGQEAFFFDRVAGSGDGEILSAFLRQFYSKNVMPAPEILLSEDIPEAELIEHWLAGLAGRRVLVHTPQRGGKREFVAMAEANATIALQNHLLARGNRQQLVLEELQRVLGLPGLPNRIEGYDISSTQGTEQVGSMVVWENGGMKKDDYKRFRIRTVAGADDFASLREVLERRFARALEEGTPLPDLVLIDGGRGQLNVGVHVLQDLGLDYLPVVALAKQEEEVYRPDSLHPLVLDRTSPALQTLQRIRDEAHRFAITYHKKLRARRTIQSVLDTIPGVGPTIRTSLLKTLGSARRVREASVAELASVPKVTPKLAQRLYDHLHAEDRAEIGTEARPPPASRSLPPSRRSGTTRGNMSSDRYPFREIEARWQRAWEERGQFRVREDPARPKFYCLEMFPYPSGRIHMGHVRVYAIGDLLARYKWMRGFNVLHPMGWDAFGLPAENAAIEHGVHPAIWTHENIAYMRSQLRQLGLSYDWDREVATCDPEYYRWEQLIFIRMLERGLAYRRRSTVNWCPSCQTVLANEQVEEGRCWRCDSEVVPREIDGWYFKITAYAEELLAWCDRLPGWPERVMTMQRNWIGRSEGAEFDLPVAGRPGLALRVFTTRPDTAFGMTYAVLAPEHPLVDQLVQGEEEHSAVAAFRAEVGRQSEIERTAADRPKRGLRLTARAVNPFNGAEVPLFIADYVLMGYGTGAIMAVPGEDERDWEFAEQHGLPIIETVERPPGFAGKAYTGAGVKINSGFLDGLSVAEAKRRAIDWLVERGLGTAKVNYRLRDWGISRQRYWGAPIPVLYCEACGMVPEREENLPVVLPQDAQISGKGGSPLAEVPSFVHARCPRCGGRARRETDTMDTFVESSWYFLRYCSPRYPAGMVETGAADYWMPVDQYIGGIEHAVLHLLYARFYTKVLRDLGLVKVDEPFTALLSQGMVIKDGAKMSKSKGNVVDPDDLIRNLGADTARLFSLFAAPPEKDLDWNDHGVEGASRFLNRVWRFVTTRLDEIAAGPPAAGAGPVSTEPGRAFRRVIHETIARVTDDLDRDFHFNTAISAIMELVNALHAFESASGAPAAGIPGLERRALLREAVDTVLLLLGPFCPHLTEELWAQLGHETSLFATPWPVPDPAALVRDDVTVVVQVDGRVRGRLVLPSGAADVEARTRALDDDRVRPWIEGRRVARVVVVPDRLVNIVTQ